MYVYLHSKFHFILCINTCVYLNVDEFNLKTSFVVDNYLVNYKWDIKYDEKIVFEKICTSSFFSYVLDSNFYYR